MANGTFVAFIGLGLDEPMARKLMAQGITVGRAQQMADAELEGHGFSAQQIKLLRGKERPAIGRQVVEAVLWDSGFSCVLCGGTDIIIHHVEAWERSHSHDPSNLVVLCLKHHGEAHTVRDLSLALDAGTLREHRSRHCEGLREQRARAALSLSPDAELLGGYVIWDYFNHGRVADLAAQLRDAGALSQRLSDCFRELALTGVLTRGGGFAFPQQFAKLSYIYQEKSGIERPLNRFCETVVRDALARSAWIDLTDDAHWQRGFIARHVRTGSMVVCKGVFHFRSQGTIKKGPSQARPVFSARRGIRLGFVIDGWEALSSSAYTSHLVGTGEMTAICLVRSVTRTDDGGLQIEATCIAIGCGFGPSLTSRKPVVAYLREQADWCDGPEGGDGEP